MRLSLEVYREALEEGRQEGELAAKLAFIPRLLVLELKVEQIAQALELRESDRLDKRLQGERGKGSRRLRLLSNRFYMCDHHVSATA
jgi:hypothetical protein